MKIKVKLIKGLAGKDQKQKQALRSLGLKKIYEERILEKNPAVLGNLDKVRHLVKVEEVE
ncbi:MAG TPA: 50S ribosomal protein L30 [Sulfurihydrogenibium sp.]|jgi:large subunit ribosomal protein L30|uniref:Large ribosomal subunit protein uL30 n=1 Tax=Sulfurihydrogenibium sp. (strain YO3AOP1) TaxID=436114 RepID=RL30_SULSY|nr:50S ribosomal protein L30 [Sulfurihydrogenibium sp. YO3AOP1]B2V7J5.1 RecName: Full=Large ribosomal subunit protein uL30; AltName: Full=50S ribosomal protein L30 [Sulfurihydrogenibium sp. YO3AOP1]ACD65918.1 ribosomal protein L30 [Sulfurihydrogenibium sp. YO3AOP1]HBT99298.1 50S ribosomal protein L30 [Sulfurihydrogenibium sp.]